jgi:CubicO group peptidase (beta-lactamase class C family)
MKWILILIMLFLSLLTACQTKQHKYSHEEITNYAYKTPIQLADGWETGRPEPNSISLEIFDDGVRAIMRGEFPNIHSVLVAQKGKLIFEEYFPGYTYTGEWIEFDNTTPHTLQSGAKSITSMIIGIAIDQGYIKDIDSFILNWYPEYDRPDLIDKKAITIRHFLTMQSGLEWNEWTMSHDRFNDLNRFYRSKKPTDFLLRKELVHKPGSKFVYNSGITNLLGDIIYRSTGQYIDEYAQQELFKPLGINCSQWEKVNHIIAAAGGLKLLPRNLLKIGQLILQKGVWKGRQIISEEWLTQSLYPSVHINFETDFGFYMDYGFQWWLPGIIHPGTQKVLEPYLAAGWGGQYLIIYPEQELIIVATGGNYETEDLFHKWHNDFFLHALILK